MSGDKTQICILGGGFGGLYTALYLSKFSWASKCNIVVIEQKDRFLFTPLLYELLSDEFQPREIAPSYQKLLRSKNITFRQGKIIGVDLETQQVKLEREDSIAYDYLVIAVGMKGKTANIPGAAEYALNFRSLADVEYLQARLAQLSRSGRVYLQVAIVGAGASGVELACKLGDILPKKSQIHLIDRSEEILKDFSPRVRSAAYRALDRRRIKANLATNIAKITQESITIEHLNNSVTLPCDLVLWTAGVESIDWVSQLTCKHDETGRILTLPTLELLDLPVVFALGDAAKIHNSRRSIPLTAQAAYQQASCIANNIQAAIKGKPLKPFRYLHLGDMLTLGANEAVISSFGLLITGYLGAILRKLIYIQRLPTNRHRLLVLKNFILQGIKAIFSPQGRDRDRKSSKKTNKN